MAATLDIISNQVSNLYNYVTANMQANQLNLINEIKNSENRIFANVRADLTYVNTAIQNNLNTTQSNLSNAISGVYSNVTNSTTKLSVDLQAKMNSISSAIQQKVDGTNVQIQARLNAINQDIKDTVNTGIQWVLNDVDKRAGEINEIIANKISDLMAVDKSLSNQTQVLLKETANRLTEQIKADTAKAAESQSIIVSKINSGNATLQKNLTETINAIQVKASPKPKTETNILEDLFNAIFGSPVYAQDNNDSNPDAKFQPKLIVSGGNITVDTAPDFLGLGQIGKAISDQLHQIETIVDRATKDEYKTLDAFESDFRKLGVNTDFVNSILQLLFIIPSLLNIGKAKTDVFNERINRLNAEKYNLARLDVGSIVELFKRGTLDRSTALGQITGLGFSDSDASNLIKLGEFNFDLNTLVRAVHRGVFTSDFARNLAKILGVKADQWLNYLTISEVRPTINDYIQFAVKEVYAKDITDKFGQYLEFPEEFATRAQKEGLNREYAQQYWASHWQLPSAQMGYEMFHRGIINENDLKLLLKSLDVMPYWRDKLVQLNYANVTRVDARRLHAYNLYSDSDLYNSYLRLGYKPTDAQKLVQFANFVEDEQENPKKKKLKDLTYNTLLTAYRRGIISRESAKAQIMPLGYSNDEVDLLLRLEDYQIYVDTHKSKKDEHNSKLSTMAINAYNSKAISEVDLLQYLVQAGYSDNDAKQEVQFAKAEYAIKLKAEIAKSIQRMYMEGLYEDNDVLAALQTLNFVPTEAAGILGEMKLLKQFNTKKPSLSQFTKLFNQGVITEDKYKEIIIEEGYADEYVPYMLALAGIETE